MSRAYLPALRRLQSTALVSVTMFACSALHASEQWLSKMQPGDNLWNFSLEHLTGMRSMRRLQTMNNVANPKRLRPGPTLKVPMGRLKVAPVLVPVDEVKGTVSAANLLGKPMDIAAGTKLLIGTTTRTGEDGNATPQFADTALLTMRSSAEVTLESMSAYGSTVMVDSRFEITTPAAVAAVRGTFERVAAYGQTMLTEVTESEALVASSAGNTRVPERIR